jgi:hypothetical protein
MIRSAHLLFSLSALFFLGACASGMFSAPARPCPVAGIIAEAETSLFYAPATAQADDAALVAGSRIGNFRGACRPHAGGGVEFALEIDFSAWRGAAGKDVERVNFPYFVAVIGPGDEILQRQAAETRIDLPASGRWQRTEKRSIHIPMDNPDDAALYKIAIGYILTPEQQNLMTRKMPDAVQPAKNGKPDQSR